MKVNFNGVEMEGTPKEVFMLLSLMKKPTSTVQSSTTPTTQLRTPVWTNNQQGVARRYGYEKYDERGAEFKLPGFEAQA